MAALGYISANYGSPANIPGLLGGHYQGYDAGGPSSWLPPGLTLAVNGTGQPERVLSPSEYQALSQRGTGAGLTVNGDMVLRQPADIGILMSKISYAVAAGSLGGGLGG